MVIWPQANQNLNLGSTEVCGAAGKENDNIQKEGRGGDVVDNRHRKHKNEYSTNQNGDSKYIHYGEEKTVKKQKIN